MPWLAELVQASEGSLDVLPVQCLCEFLLLDKSAEIKKGKEDESAAREQQEKRLVCDNCQLSLHHSPITPESDQCQNSPAASQEI